MTDTKAKKALILKMMRGFPSSQERITEGVVAAYLEAVAEIGLEAVDRSVTQFITGRVEGRNNAFLPTAAELASNARLWQEAIATVETNRALAAATRMVPYKIGEGPPPPAKPLGPIRLEVGGIMRDTSDWSHEEKEFAMRTGKLPPTRQVTNIVQRLAEGKGDV